MSIIEAPRHPAPSRPRSSRNRGSAAAGRREVPVTTREIELHGRRVVYLEAGAHSGGPVVVLVHGLASSSQTWASVMALLGRYVHVIAPDLLGHGRSAKPPGGDYSLGSYAAGLRDLLVALDVDRATIVGHSFGGGVGMQFAYQFPEFTQRLVLVASGGLGQGVSMALRAATLPGTAAVLQLASALTPSWLLRLTQRAVRALPVVSSSEIDGLAGAFTSFADAGARAAFAHTVSGALNWSGQRLDGTGRLYLLAEVPVLLVGGTRDRVIPFAHTATAHDLITGSRLEIFDNAGHFPHQDHPQRFADLLRDFLDTSTAARADRRTLRRQLLGQPVPDQTGST